MSPALLLASAAGLFTVLPGASRGGILVSTVLPMALAISFAIAVAGRPSSAALVSGALSAFVGSFAWAMFPALGGAVLLSVGYAERTLRVRSRAAKLAHAGLAVAAGGVAGSLAAAYAGSPLLYRGVATVMCAVLSAVPLLVHADDARVLALEDAAKRVGPPLAATLLEGAELLRCGDVSLLDKVTARNVHKSWRSLDRLVEARLAMRAGRGDTAAMVTAMVDRQITEHIASLTRAYAAVTTAGAAEVGMDDSAIRDVHARGEALEVQSRAIVEAGADLTAR